MFNKNKLNTLLEKINWLSDSFEKNNYSNISALEKSLLKEKVMMFYDEIENIPTTVFKPNKQSSVDSSQSSVDSSQPPVSGSQSSVDSTNSKVVSQQIEEKVVEPVSTVNQSEEKIQEVVTNNIQQPEPNKQPITTNNEQKTKEEKFKKTAQFQKEIAMPKRDIREIIDLNKSFILKAELFNQNNDLYNSFIQEINQTRTEFAAETVVKKWVAKLNWQTEENKAYELLERAVEKRFLPLIS